MQKRARVTRREAADILGVSVSYIRKLSRQRKLSFFEDRNGWYVAYREQVEALARERDKPATAGGKFAARVFAMFEANMPFAKIVIETGADPDTIQNLRDRYDAGFLYGKQHEKAEEDDRLQREHEAQMREMDVELERRRRASLGDDDDKGPSKK